MRRPRPVVAIDGPGGSGKSTVSRALARALLVDHLDTGAMYRAVALAALERGLALTDDEALGELATDVELEVGEKVLLDGVDVTAEIRSEAVTNAVSPVAAQPSVRAELVRRQREWVGARDGAVVEGRDIGSVVLPDATLKIYLTASEDERARRRSGELAERADAPSLDAVRAAIGRRDAIDSGRAHAPLTVAAGAVVIDSTGHRADEVVDQILSLLAEGGS